MKTKLLSLLIALIGVITLSSCEPTIKTLSTPIDFAVTANCDAAGIKKIEALFKEKGLPVGKNITISVVVDKDAPSDEGFKALDDEIKNILKKSGTVITSAEFHALSTGATYSVYTAHYHNGRLIGTANTTYGL